MSRQIKNWSSQVALVIRIPLFVNTEQALDKIKEDYCKAIVTLGQDKELAKQMGLNGYKYVNSKLTWDEKYRVIVNDM